jgi:hypothetical protein
MSIAFLTELHRPATLRELVGATEAMLAELLAVPEDTLTVTALEAGYWWENRSDRPCSPRQATARMCRRFSLRLTQDSMAAWSTWAS